MADRLNFPPEPEGPPLRGSLQQRWLDLTRRQLPAAAPLHRWPIRLDHCFMRVCLDHALGARWDTLVPRPALRNLSDSQLTRAIQIAEQLLAQPHLLPQFNQQSLLWRGKLKSPLS